MKLLRTTGGLWFGLWLVCFIGGLVKRAETIDWRYWQMDLILTVIFAFIGFLGYSVLRGRLWASRPLGFVALLLGIWMFLTALAAGFSLSVTCILVFSAWTFWISFFLPCAIVGDQYYVPAISKKAARLAKSFGVSISSVSLYRHRRLLGRGIVLASASFEAYRSYAP